MLLNGIRVDVQTWNNHVSVPPYVASNLFDVLNGHGSFHEQLHAAQARNDNEKIATLLTHRILTDRAGTSLHWAVMNNQKEMVLLLLKEGADINAKGDICDCMLEYTPLQLATVWNGGNPDMVNLLLEHGADSPINKKV
jgi:ankyrin repeat protein